MRTVIGAAIGALLLLLALRRRRGETERDRDAAHPEDCEVSECGADGVPLSRYAG